VKSGLLMIVSIYAKVSIMQFETPTSSLKANNHQVGKTCHFANHPYLCKSLNQLIKKDTQKPSAQINQSA
jgi:hypothetical protein